MCLKILIRRKSVLRESGMLGSKDTVKLSKNIWHQIKNRERKGPSGGIIQKCAPHERSPCAEIRGRSTLHQERCARKTAWDAAKHIYKLKNSDKTMYYVPGEVKAMLAPTSKRPEEREFVLDSGALVHMMSKKELSSEEMGTVKRSRNPTVVLTANGEVHTHEGAQVFVRDLKQFVTVQLLEETPTVLPPSKLCKDHGYSYQWVSGQEPRLTKEGKSSVCSQFWKQFVTYIVTTRIVQNRSSPSLWKQSCFEIIFTFSI